MRNGRDSRALLANWQDFVAVMLCAEGRNLPSGKTCGDENTGTFVQ
jgi:hypothetical protein